MAGVRCLHVRCKWPPGSSATAVRAEVLAHPTSRSVVRLVVARYWSEGRGRIKYC